MRPPDDPNSVPSDSAPRQRVWDLPLRACHWGLVLTVSGSFATHYVGTRAFALHTYCGYATLVLVAFRLAWGWVGPAHARYADFVRGPRAVWASLGGLRPGAYRPTAGHTPLGGWMVLLLLGLLAAQALLGLYANDEIVDAGPFYGYVSHALSNRLTAWHHRLADALLIAVGVHVAAALYYRFVLGADLVRPLFTGYKRGLPLGSGIGSQRLWLALLLMAAAAGTLYWVIRSAPEASVLLM
jgi:cytochrome b